MAIRVLIVDDSRFFRRRVKEMLESDPQIKVIGDAENGSDAIQQAARLKPDLITMDIEMPIMDGITATKRILASQKIPILMFSSLTHEGAQATFDALEAGAIDYLPKRFEEISNDKQEAKRQLCEKIKIVARQKVNGTNATQQTRAPVNRQPDISPNAKSASGVTANKSSVPAKVAASTQAIQKGQFSLVVIGTSTGGPVALQHIMTKIPANFPMPILMVQHMPSTFTGAFAQRLNTSCAITVKEAQDGDEMKPGLALLAPGGKQMLMERVGSKHLVRIIDATPDQNYRPCVDVTFNSVAKISASRTLAIVLTGMGADGCEGAKTLKRGGASVWAQNEETCVVYGMPHAIVEAGLADHIFSLDDIGTNLAQRI